MSNRFYSNRIKIKKRRSTDSGPKAFKSEESANKWAKENNMKNYTLRNLRGEGKKKKIKIQII